MNKESVIPLISVRFFHFHRFDRFVIVDFYYCAIFLKVLFNL